MMVGLVISADTTSRKPSKHVQMERRKKSKKKLAYQHNPLYSSSSVGPVTPSTQKNTEDLVVISNAKQCIDANITPERGGVILYTIYQKRLYIGLAIDSASHDLTDFGGRIYYDTDPNCITGSLREFHEETLGIFNPITVEQVENYTTIHDNNNLILFLHLNVNPNTVSEKFLAVHSDHITLMENTTHRNLEVCGITWLTITSFINAVGKYGTIYERVRKVLQQVKDWRQIF